MNPSEPIRQAMLMAAGLGTRLRPFTDRIPKALVPVLGIPIAQLALDQLAEAGVKKVVVNIHHMSKQAMSGFRDLDLRGMELIFSDETAQILGSAGGLRRALPFFGKDPFLLVNADVICNVSLSKLSMQHWRLRSQHDAKLTLAVFKKPPDSVGPNSRYREIFLDPLSCWIKGLGELEKGKPYFIGAAVVEHEAISSLPEGVPLEFVPEVLKPAIAQNKAGAFLTEGFWSDVGSPYLWWKTQLELLSRLETGAISTLLRRRVESINRRIGTKQWVSHRTTGYHKLAQFTGSCYWDCEEPQKGLRRNGNKFNFGPDLILYGPPQELSAEDGATSGLGFEGIWLPQEKLLDTV